MAARFTRIGENRADREFFGLMSISWRMSVFGLWERKRAVPKLRRTPMQYALLIYQQEAVAGLDPGSAALAAIVGRHMAFAGALGAKRVGGSGLKTTASATTVRTQGAARTVHDGPFAETREQLGGFYLIEAADLDEAIEIAGNVPLAGDGAIEIRPLLGPG